MDKDLAIKTPHLRHQLSIYLDHRDDPWYGLLWEMGLGKSKTIIDIASYLFLRGRINGLIILAPNSVYTNWATQELPAHIAVPYVKLLFRSSEKGDRRIARRAMFLGSQEYNDRLRILIMSYDGLRTDHGFKLAQDFSLLYRCMIIADESTALKNPGTQTAKKAKKIRASCTHAWIATGTPVAQSPFDIHSQIEFLCPEFWATHGVKSHGAFKTQFGVYEQRRAGMKVFSTCVGYRNLDKLHGLIKSMTSRLLKDETIDLPPKMYKTVMFELAPEQRRVYDELRKTFLAELESGGTVEATLAIVRLTRLQQIASGFVTADVQPTSMHQSRCGVYMGDNDGTCPQLTCIRYKGHEGLHDNVRGDEETNSETTEQDYAEALDAFQLTEDVVEEAVTSWATDVVPRIVDKRIVDVILPENNPRLKVLLEIVEQCSHKMIVWCKFKRDVEIVCEALGDQCVRYDGDTKTKDREIALNRFRDADDPAKILVANIHAISQGVTLIIAKTMVHYTNSFSPEKRLQSDDRAHRIGQTMPVLIIDLVAEDTVDEKLVETLRKKYDTAATVMGDRYREWIQPITRSEE